jgi:hypothetical protein
MNTREEPALGRLFIFKGTGATAKVACKVGCLVSKCLFLFCGFLFVGEILCYAK